MTTDEFRSVLERRLSKTTEVLDKKSKEYSVAADKLYSFKEGAKLLQTSPTLYCLHLMTKHMVSVYDMVRKMEGEQGVVPSREYVDEKIGDAQNYLVLLEALIEEVRVGLTKQQ